MTECFDTGTLRLYLERSLASAGGDRMPDAERASIADHLATCADCRAQLDDLRALEARVMSRLSVLAPTQAPDLQVALVKMRAKLREQENQSTTGKLSGGNLPHKNSRLPPIKQGRNIMNALVSREHRKLQFSALVALLAVSIIWIPPLRAAADTILQSFRVKSVIFLPVDGDRLQQLSTIYSDPTALFITQPKIDGTPQSTTASTAKEAAQLAGFTPEQPSAFPSAPTSTRFTVNSNTKIEAQVNIDNIRQLLITVGITDIALPDALGSAPITADVPTFVVSEYQGNGYDFTLAQGTSPTVNLPKGVDLAQLGEAGLRLIGMQPDQAREMSRQIDWSSTLVVPFPANLSDVLRVQVGDAQGLLVSSGGASNDVGLARHNLVLYWQRGDHFYVLSGWGPALNNDMVLLAARSVK